MSYEIVVQSEPIIEMQKAFEWYEYKQEGKGFEMIEEIETVYEKLSNHPHHYSYTHQRNEKYRKIRIDRFPYLLIYEIEDTKVVIVAYRHINQERRS